MKYSSFVLVSSIIGCLLVTTSIEAQTSPEAGAAVVLETVGSGRVVVPKWGNGRFFTFDIGDRGDRAPKVYLLGRNGKHVLTVPVVIPDSFDTAVMDVSISPRGELAIAGGLSDSVGGSGFIAFVSEEGNIRQLVRTSPFTPRFISFTGDGSLWAAGWELDANGRYKAEYNVLRHYGTDGALIKSALPRGSSATYADHRSPVSQSFLVTSGDIVGMYCVRTNEWIEVSSSTGAILSRRPGLGGGRDARVWGVALTSSGSVYASVSAAIYKLSRDSSVWQPVNDIRGRIAGLDGDMLVSQRKSEMIWVKVGSK